MNQDINWIDEAFFITEENIEEVKANMKEVLENDEKYKNFLDKLQEPSGLRFVLLTSDYWKGKERLLDFTGTTIQEAIEKILRFYKHKTYRRNVGDHIFFEGWFKKGNFHKCSLGS